MSHGGKKKKQPWEDKDDGPTNNMSVYKEDLFKSLMEGAKEAAKEMEKEKPRPAAVLDLSCPPEILFAFPIFTGDTFV
jgi:hypothetical protein